jgi:hypothetical protein
MIHSAIVTKDDSFFDSNSYSNNDYINKLNINNKGQTNAPNKNLEPEIDFEYDYDVENGNITSESLALVVAGSKFAMLEGEIEPVYQSFISRLPDDAPVLSDIQFKRALELLSKYGINSEGFNESFSENEAKEITNILSKSKLSKEQLYVMFELMNRVRARKENIKLLENKSISTIKVNEIKIPKEVIPEPIEGIFESPVVIFGKKSGVKQDAELFSDINKIISFGGSRTNSHKYAIDNPNTSNQGSYSKDDIIGISIPTRSSVDFRENLELSKVEIKIAMEASSTIVFNGKNKEVKEFLMDNGYSEYANSNNWSHNFDFKELENKNYELISTSEIIKNGDFRNIGKIEITVESFNSQNSIDSIREEFNVVSSDIKMSSRVESNKYLLVEPDQETLDRYRKMNPDILIILKDNKFKDIKSDKISPLKDYLSGLNKDKSDKIKKILEQLKDC